MIDDTKLLRFCSELSLFLCHLNDIVKVNQPDLGFDDDFVHAEIKAASLKDYLNAASELVEVIDAVNGGTIDDEETRETLTKYFTSKFDIDVPESNSRSVSSGEEYAISEAPNDEAMSFNDYHEGIPGENEKVLLNGLATKTGNASVYDARRLRGLSTCKMKITIDPVNSKIILAKVSDKDSGGFDIYSPKELLQVQKSSRNPFKLKMRFINDNKQSFILSSNDAVDKLCTDLRKMKSLSNIGEKTVSSLSVFVGTWNMGHTQPLCDLNQWLDPTDGKATVSQTPHVYDVYVIGTQESEMSEREWIDKLKRSVQTDAGGQAAKLVSQLETVTVISSWGLRLVVLAKAVHIPHILRIQTHSIKTGFGHTLGNKGAVVISFLYRDKSFCFINSHLAARATTERLKLRNEQFRTIVEKLNVLYAANSASGCDFIFNFDLVLWFGDLNYRLSLDLSEIVKLIDKQNYDRLLQSDQLKIVQKAGDAFYGFNEAEITFRPTYKYLVGHRNMYHFKKVTRTVTRINVPSWCDRILWRSKPDMRVECESYGCTQDIAVCDHKPVFAKFTVAVSPPPVPVAPLACSTRMYSLTLTDVCLEVALSMSSISIELIFHGAPLTEDFIMPGLKTPWPDRDNYLRAEWPGDHELVRMRRQLHGLVCLTAIIVNRDSDSIVGNASVSFDSSEEPKDFSAEVILSCRPVGSIAGSVRSIPVSIL